MAAAATPAAKELLIWKAIENVCVRMKKREAKEGGEKNAFLQEFQQLQRTPSRSLGWLKEP